MHIGDECFSACDQQAGQCNFCGARGLCCRAGQNEEACGNAGCLDKHCCTYQEETANILLNGGFELGYEGPPYEIIST